MTPKPLISFVFMGIALFFSGCNLVGGASEGPTTAHDTVQVFVHDTTRIYTTPPKPGAPIIQSLEIDRLKGVDSLMHNYITVSWSAVPNSVGYKVYYSTSLSGPFSTVPNGQKSTYSDTNRWGIYFSAPGTYFFQVTAVNNDGVESDPSPHKAIVYDGV